MIFPQAPGVTISKDIEKYTFRGIVDSGVFLYFSQAIFPRTGEFPEEPRVATPTGPGPVAGRCTGKANVRHLRVLHGQGERVEGVVQVQVRCAGCNRRLADLVNEVEAGQILIELKCPRCGHPHLEVIRRQPPSAAEP